MLWTHVLVAHVPVGPLAVGHHLPHDDAVAPHVAGPRELPILDGFRRRPPDRDLPSLRTLTHLKDQQITQSINTILDDMFLKMFNNKIIYSISRNNNK